MEQECRTLVSDPRKGKNMFVLGMLCNLYSLDMDLAREQIAFIFGKKADKVIKSNVALLEAGYAWAEQNLDFGFRVPAVRATEPQLVINGNTAIGARRARLGHGHLRDVPDHAGHFRLALPERRLRARRRHRAPGRGRDRGLRVRDRRLLRGQGRGDDHLRARATRSSRKASASP